MAKRSRGAASAGARSKPRDEARPAVRPRRSSSSAAGPAVAATTRDAAVLAVLAGIADSRLGTSLVWFKAIWMLKALAARARERVRAAAAARGGPKGGKKRGRRQAAAETGSKLLRNRLAFLGLRMKVARRARQRRLLGAWRWLRCRCGVAKPSRATPCVHVLRRGACHTRWRRWEAAVLRALPAPRARAVRSTLAIACDGACLPAALAR